MAHRRAAFGGDFRPDSERQYTLGQLLALGDGLTPHDDHPLSLVLSSRLKPDAADSFIQDPYGLAYQRQMAEIPRDVFMQAEWLATFSNRPHFPQLRDQVSQVSSARRPSLLSSDPNLSPSEIAWRALVEASHILVTDNSSFGHNVGFHNAANVPEMTLWRPFQVRSLTESESAAYMAALEQFVRAGASELQAPFEERSAEFWRELGLDTAAAEFAAKNDQGASSRLVGWHCSLHLEALVELSETAALSNQFESAADWFELAAKVANRMAESVRSPSIYNYVLKKRAALRSDAQDAARSGDCPPEIAARLKNVIDSLQPTGFRSIAAPARELLPALCLDSLSRAFLSTAVVTALVGCAIWLCCRFSVQPRAKSPDASAGWPFVVAIVAIVPTLLTLCLLEASNCLGEGAGSVTYGVMGIAFTVAILMGAWSLIVSERVRDGDSSERSLRRRLHSLVGFAVIAISCRLLLSFGSGQSRLGPGFSQLQRWGFDPSHERLPIAFRIVFTMAFPILLGWYAWLRHKRWERNPSDLPLVHPVIFAVAGVVLGAWMLLGPFGEWVNRGLGPAPSYPTEWTPAVVAADAYGNLLEAEYFWTRARTSASTATFGRGANLLTATLALRLTNLGFWLVVNCAVIWAFTIWCSDRPSRTRHRSNLNLNEPPQSFGFTWLDGLWRSSFWLASIALVLYGWSTFGAAYCINRVMAHG